VDLRLKKLKHGNLFIPAIPTEIMEHLHEYDAESVSTIPLNEPTEYVEEDTLSYEGDVAGLGPFQQNTHLYFDDGGNEISRQEFLAQERDEGQWVFQTSQLPERFVLRHPRVLLNFLRFVDSLNEINNGNETFMMDAIPYETLARMLSHNSITNPPAEFQEDVEELIDRLVDHANLSG